ncbi:MAG: DEAD/DEAH box helicase family protein [Syntrophobacterales bacterium]|nr:DEAD/DEAH box helicase family protein [Syntrophobacterales bacterium]
MKIEKYLVLNRYLLSLFGVDEFKKLQNALADKRVGYDPEGRSYFVEVLCALDGLKQSRLPEDRLLEYDEQIRICVGKINHRREPKIVLKYFQYLALLFTEIVLDALKNRKAEFLHDLNEFLKAYKQGHDIDLLDEFTEDNLRKIAFWMATGSGKTLLMHINYHQFQRYKLFSPDNILLITPNEGLSRQHFEELQKSGIPCRLYAGNLGNTGNLPGEEPILIIEMTKLVEEKKGGGVTLPIEVFEGRNLIFVDEGHKGKRSEEQKWAKLRNKLAVTGFTFEYSATFGQILSEKQEETLQEYAKSIIFDYSYRYFYLDGYGKDFTVLNVKQGGVGEQVFQEMMFVANLLSYFQQMLIYEQHQPLARQYNLEKPLWIFVGTTVTGREEESDVIQIVAFFKRLLDDEQWVRTKADAVLSGESGLKDENEGDAFSDSYDFITESGLNMDDLYKKVFGGRGQFRVHEIKNADGEFGLRVGENDYFGVVNIGDVSAFKNELVKKGISVEPDAVSPSLFDAIKKEGSPIQVLIGSKKFIEGWDTWRVSSMGLLNIGTGQGPQIIQLFGRGIRLKGKDYSLKRSADKGPVKYLEMLHIYGMKADYLSRFLAAIKKEEVEFESIDIPVALQHEEKWRQLWWLSKDESKRFEEDVILPLAFNTNIHVSLNLLPRVTLFVGKERDKADAVKIHEMKAEDTQRRLSDNEISLLNWKKIFEEIQEFKASKNYWNLVFSIEGLKNILLSNRYRIIALADTLVIKTRPDLERIDSIACLLLKKYIDQFYVHHRKRYETKYMRYEMMKRQTALPLFEKGENQYAYTVQIDKKETKLIEDVKKLKEDLEKLLKQEEKKILPRVYFDRHLYLPILLKGINRKIDKISPAGLEESEKDFLVNLKQYLEDKKKKFRGCEIYLLRNFPKTGVGFFNLSNFYPDFIMWIKSKDRQRIVFLDPHGLEHDKSLDNQKIQLSKDIKQLEKKLGDRKITLDSFILSKTSYESIKKDRTSAEPKEEFKANHVLFLEDQEDWPAELFQKIFV